MVDIEKEIEKSFPCDPLQYWKAVVQRKYFAMENIYKQRDPDDPRKEMNSASSFFIWASRLIIFMWIIAASLLIFWGQRLGPIT